MSVGEVAREGQRLATLIELRDVVADAIDACSSKRDLAALTSRLQLILLEVEMLEGAPRNQDPLNDLLERRQRRLLAADGEKRRRSAS